MLVAYFDDSGIHEDFWWQRHALQSSTCAELDNPMPPTSSRLINTSASRPGSRSGSLGSQSLPR